MSDTPPRDGRRSTLGAKALLAPDAPINGTRDRLIWSAMDLFYEHGFHAVGLDRILAEVGVTKTTFYNHFESKDELMVAVLETRHHWEMKALMRDVERTGEGDPRRMLLAIFDVLDVWFNDDEFLGCMFINAAHEFPNPHDPVHRAAAAHKHQTLSMLRSLAQRAGLDDPDDIAEQLLVLIEGAITTRLVTANHAAAAIAKRTAELILERQPA